MHINEHSHVNMPDCSHRLWSIGRLVLRGKIETHIYTVDTELPRTPDTGDENKTHDHIIKSVSWG